jgi:hypothetical protein
MKTPRIEEIRDKIYYEHLEDILAHAERRHLAKDEKQHVDDQRERIHKMLDLVVKLITEAHQAGRDELTHSWNKAEQRLDGTDEGALNCIEQFRETIKNLHESN